MEKIKANVTSITGTIMLVLSVLNLIISKSDYVYRPKNYVLFLVVYIILAVAMSFCSIKFKEKSKKNDLASFLPLIAIIYLITLLFSFDFSIDYKTYSLLYYEVIFVVTLVSSLIIFFIYNNIKWVKIIVGIISAGIGALFCFVLFISLIFMNFGRSDILQIVNSPDSTYVAIAISHDEGALGGDTCVRVRKNKQRVNLLIGSITRREQQLWIGEWASEPSLKWEDNDTILINDVRYDLE